MITGATGFTGSFLVEAYAERGWQVYGTYRDDIEDESWIPAGATLHRVDLLNVDQVRELVHTVRPDLVHHLAAQSSVSTSWNDPLGTLTMNASMQQIVLDCVLSLGQTVRVVVVGSCDEYGNAPAENSPLSESAELRPASPYAMSKVVQDLMGRQYAEIEDMDVVRVRPFLQLGPRRSSHFVAGSFARQTAEIEMGLRDPIIDVGSVDLVRDFTDVRDVARAFTAVAEHGETGEAYNIASGSGHSLRDLLHVMLDLVGARVTIRERADLVRRRETPVLLGDASRLRAVSGWEPRIPFERSAEDTLSYWHQRLRENSRVERNRA